MKPEDIKVGGIYEWRKGFNWRLKSNAANPHLDKLLDGGNEGIEIEMGKNRHTPNATVQR